MPEIDRSKRTGDETFASSSSSSEPIVTESIRDTKSCASSLDPVSGASVRPNASFSTRDANVQLLRSTPDDSSSINGGEGGHLRFLDAGGGGGEVGQVISALSLLHRVV
jgi:hypothetical protein